MAEKLRHRRRDTVRHPRHKGGVSARFLTFLRRGPVRQDLRSTIGTKLSGAHFVATVGARVVEICPTVSGAKTAPVAYLRHRDTRVELTGNVMALTKAVSPLSRGHSVSFSDTPVYRRIECCLAEPPRGVSPPSRRADLGTLRHGTLPMRTLRGRKFGPLLRHPPGLVRSFTKTSMYPRVRFSTCPCRSFHKQCFRQNAECASCRFCERPLIVWSDTHRMTRVDSVDCASTDADFVQIRGCRLVESVVTLTNRRNCRSLTKNWMVEK